MNYTKEALERLLTRRKNYFLMDAHWRDVYLKDFEKIQSEIINLKLHFEIYQDELDLLIVCFDYTSSDSKDKIKACETAVEHKEIKWLRKKYYPETYKAEYIGLMLKMPSDEWLKMICEEHLLKREGHFQCPWPVKVE